MNFSTYFLSLLKLLLLLRRIRPHNNITSFASWKYTLLGDLLREQERCERNKSNASSLPALSAVPLLVEAGRTAPLNLPPPNPLSSPAACPLAPASFGPGRMRPSLRRAQIATQRTSPCHVCRNLRHAFPVSAQHLSSLGRHEIAEGPIWRVSDPPSPGDPPSRTTHGTLNFNPAVPFVWRGETIYEESYKINTKSSP